VVPTEMASTAGAPLVAVSVPAGALTSISPWV
jgi:hypothetical protein